jgi:hypothetical protein
METVQIVRATRRAPEAGIRGKLRQFAATQSELPQTIILSLVGSFDEVARLLSAPDPRVRAHAADCVLARPDAPELFAAARRLSQHADTVFARAQMQLMRIERIKAELAAMPDFALAWRAKWMEHSEIDDDGMWLAYEQALDRERRLALAAP